MITYKLALGVKTKGSIIFFLFERIVIHHHRVVRVHSHHHGLLWPHLHVVMVRGCKGSSRKFRIYIIQKILSLMKWNSTIKIPLVVLTVLLMGFLWWWKINGTKKLCLLNYRKNQRWIKSRKMTLSLEEKHYPRWFLRYLYILLALFNRFCISLRFYFHDARKEKVASQN